MVLTREVDTSTGRGNIYYASLSATGIANATQTVRLAEFNSPLAYCVSALGRYTLGQAHDACPNNLQSGGLPSLSEQCII